MENATNTSIQSPMDIVNSLLSTANTAAAPVQAVPIPALGFTMPTGSDITGQYQTFLNQVSQDPSILNYYNQLLSYAQGDTDAAISLAKNVYNTTVQQTGSNLQNALGQLGTQFTTESNSLLDSLNKRGIALTQDASGKLTYGGGGESQTEVGALNTSQQLRQEAQQRSAQQTIQTAGNTLQQATTTANESLQQGAINLKNQESSDIYSRANTDMSNYTNAQVAAANLAVAKQQAGTGTTTSAAPTTDQQARAAGYQGMQDYIDRKAAGTLLS